MRSRLSTPARFFFALLASLSFAHADEAKPSTPAAAVPIKLPGIDNAFRISDRILSGSQPEGDEGFTSLAKAGIKTIITVDGSKPDVETAHKFGIRYIHLPIGYDGISTERVAQLTKAATTAEGPIFIHCHHGKHRGPAAVAIVCEATEKWTPERAEAWLKEAGTSPDYPGLFRSAHDFKAPTNEALAKVGPLPEVSKTEGMVDTMVAIDGLFDSLKAIQKAGWKTPPGHADITPAHEATILWEHFREISRTEDAAKRPAEFRTKLADAERSADLLRTGLKAPTPDSSALDAAMKAATQNCNACHKAFRNEKK